MRILLTNDDGIDAPGLAALARVAEAFGDTVWVAPHTHLSGCGHRVTTDGPIRLMQRDALRWAIDGTPADCVRVALARLAPEVDWVFSGLNAGGNLGVDVYHSGTVAATREAALHGKRAIAFSQYRKRGLEIDWPRIERWMQQAAIELLAEPHLPGVFWNVNLPHLTANEPEPRIVRCPLESAPLPLSFRDHDEGLHYDGNYHGRARVPGSDVTVCFAGDIAVTRLFVG